MFFLKYEEKKKQAKHGEYIYGYVRKGNIRDS